MTYVDLFYLIMPSFNVNLNIHFLDITTTLFIFSCLSWRILEQFKTTAIFPINEPRLQESINLEVR